MTPFGDPVVPEVNISTAIASPGSAPISPTGGGGSRSSEESRTASKVFGPSPSTTTTCAKLRQVGLQRLRHRLVIEAAEQFWHDEDLGLGEIEHVAELALAKDRHQAD